MSVKNFKFVSPGVFINEIDNSFIPRSPTEIGPAIVGRATRGIAMQPVKVEAYSDFVNMFGDTVPGRSGGDIYRNGLSTQSPIYGTYAAKAFMKSNVAPLTYVRVLGHQHPQADTAETPNWSSNAGWRTTDLASATQAGGAMGLFVWPSASFALTGAAGSATQAITGTLAAIWYTEAGLIALSGTLWSNGALSGTTGTGRDLNAVGAGATILSDTNGVFKAVHVNGAGSSTAYEFSLNDNHSKYIRGVFNTNPQLYNSGNFYPTATRTDYWLGETYDQEVRDKLAGTNGGLNSQLVGAIVAIQLSGSGTSESPANMLTNSQEAIAGWFIGQDLGRAADFNVVSKTQKLFRLKGRGHGAWLNENVKISIDNIRQSNTSTTDYGTFSVLIRNIADSDNAIQILERFDNLNLDPTSPNFISRKMGDQYTTWDEGEKRLKLYGEYPNQSKFVYIDLDPNIAAGASGLEKLLPFGYYGPPKYTDIINVLVSSGSDPGSTDASSVAPSTGYAIIGTGSALDTFNANTFMLSGAITSMTGAAGLVGTAAGTYIGLSYPSVRIRNSGSDGGITNPSRAFFGFLPTRSSGSSRFDPSTPGVQRLLSKALAESAVGDPTTGTITGIDGYAYVFTMDNIVGVSGSGTTLTDAFYASGSRASDNRSLTAQVGKSYVDLLDAGYNGFTAPLFGGFDGFNIKLPDPLYNGGMSDAATETNSSIYYSLKRAIDTLADPEQVDMNLLAAPGVTNNSLTQHLVSLCENRADAMALIDLPNVYLPSAEGDYSSLSTPASRINTTPQQSATALKDRRIDSSYGATFYPWVQTRDQNTGAAVWLPPSCAMLGVLASSQKKAQLWFAPAGFNRGGLTDGAAGIPVSAVTEKLTSKQRDILYEANINPIASFPSSGIVVFGQKTLQERQSALDRINVRRLVIYLKKQISVISTKILFEQNVQTTWNRFTGLVEPFLANVKSNFGISDYKLILDESTTTPDLIDQNIMYAKIMVKPARAIEYIAIDFVIASTGASFDD
jgi:hypothetical protein